MARSHVLSDEKKHGQCNRRHAGRGIGHENRGLGHESRDIGHESREALRKDSWANKKEICFGFPTCFCDRLACFVTSSVSATARQALFLARLSSPRLSCPPLSILIWGGPGPCPHGVALKAISATCLGFSWVLLLCLFWSFARCPGIWFRRWCPTVVSAGTFGALDMDLAQLFIPKFTREQGGTSEFEKNYT